MASATLRPNGTSFNTFTLTGGATTAHGTLGEVVTQPTTPSGTDGLTTSGGDTANVAITLPEIPNLISIISAKVWVYHESYEVGFGGTEIHVSLYDGVDNIVDDEIIYQSEVPGVTQGWVNSSSVSTSNQLQSITITGSPSQETSQVILRAAYIEVTYTASSGGLILAGKVRHGVTLQSGVNI